MVGFAGAMLLLRLVRVLPSGGIYVCACVCLRNMPTTACLCFCGTWPFPACLVAAAVRDYYTFDKALGKGNFGVVHLVFDKKTGQQYACKSISKRKLVTADDIEDVRREVQILM